MTKISANLGFLWQDIPLADAIYNAKQHGFDAVECHWPYSQDIHAVCRALKNTGLPMIGLNTALGTQDGDSGLCALPNRTHEAIASIDQALLYANMMHTKAIHVMAGIYQKTAPAEQVFIDNLLYASQQARPHGITILIEPLNRFDKAGYFLTDTVQAQQIIQKCNQDNIKIMYDCYHVQRSEGNVCHRLTKIFPLVGHIQIASSPQRAEPNTGELNYAYVIQCIANLGYTGYIGAEYIPTGDVADSLDWLDIYKKIRPN